MSIESSFVEIINEVESICNSTNGVCIGCKLEKVCNHMDDLPYVVLKELQDKIVND